MYVELDILFNMCSRLNPLNPWNQTQVEIIIIFEGTMERMKTKKIWDGSKGSKLKLMPAIDGKNTDQTATAQEKTRETNIDMAPKIAIAQICIWHKYLYATDIYM